MKTQLIFVLAFVAAVAFAEKGPRPEEYEVGSGVPEIPTAAATSSHGKKDKRGIFGYEFGLHHAGPLYSSAVVHEKVAVPVVHPVVVAVPVKVPVYVHVPKPYPVIKHIPVPIVKHVPRVHYVYPYYHGHHHFK